MQTSTFTSPVCPFASARRKPRYSVAVQCIPPARRGLIVDGEAARSWRGPRRGSRLPEVRALSSTPSLVR